MKVKRSLGFVVDYLLSRFSGLVQVGLVFGRVLVTLAAAGSQGNGILAEVIKENPMEQNPDIYPSLDWGQMHSHITTHK